ncbi:glycerol-3-phosphate 1-O-acyltransferase PlsY [Metamycoplasma buccale]|uniref:glycerol-3-phosphate 1-O-acyltransferase PlsY n=1 Tax=Metamycoplasma buccale TaxID=55602 RepID=UPI00398F5F6A
MVIWKYIYINLIIFIIGYLLGSINFGILFSRKQGKDIRTQGSGNAGATNVLRTYGIKIAIIVFVFDLLKSFIPIMILFFVKIYALKNNIFIFPLIIGFGALFGHIFPLYFKFKGGKGVACFFGIILAFHIQLFLIFLMIYIFIVLVSKYISLASVISSFIGSSLSLIKYFHVGTLAYMQSYTIYPADSIILIACTILIIFMHFPNYLKLAMHKENKLNIGLKIKK